MHKRIRMLTVLWAMSCFCGFSATSVTATDTLVVKELQGVEVVETSRTHEAYSSVPLRIWDSSDLLQRGVTDLSDVLQRIPGINLRDYGGAGGMKTMGVRGFSSAHTGIKFNGVVLNESQTGAVDLSRYTLNNVSALQLTVGDTQDVLVSARQLASVAVLSIETLHATFDNQQPHLLSQFRIGSFGLVNPFFRYDWVLNQRFVLSASGEYTYYEGNYPFLLRNGIFTTHERRTHNRMNEGRGQFDFAWKVGQNGRLTGTLFYYNSYKLLPGIVYFYSALSGEKLHEENAFTQLQWQQSSNDGRWRVRIQGKWNWFATHYRDELAVGNVHDADYNQREAYISGAVSYQPISQFFVGYAADYFFNNLSSSLSTDVRPYRNSLLQSLSVKYVTSRFIAISRLLLSVYDNGAYRGIAGRDAQRLSPSLSFSWKVFPIEQLYLRAAYKNIFRMPTFNENYFYHFGSPSLDPESTQQYTLGLTWQHQFAHAWQALFTLDSYTNRVTNQIVAVPYNMFVWTNINLGKVNSSGVELTTQQTFTITPRQQCLFYASYSFQHTVDCTDRTTDSYHKQLAYLPKHIASASVTWLNSLVNLSVSAVGMSKRWATHAHYGGTSLKSYGTIGLSAYRTFSLRNSSFMVRGEVKNLFGQQYELVANYPMPRCNYQIIMQYQF